MTDASAPTQDATAEGAHIQRRQEAIWGYALAAPATLLILTIVIVPTLMVIALSFTDYQLGRLDWSWVGVEHYVRMLLVAIPCAYALAKIRFRANPVLFAAVLLGLCIPIQVPALPLYLALANLGLLNTYFALMMPFFLSVFAIFLFRQFFKGFPDEIIQAGRLDGMSEFEIVWRVVVPSARPAIAAFSVFSMTAHWNDLYWPLIVVTRNERATPPLGVAFFFDPDTGTDFALLMASAAIISAPLVLTFLLAQRTFIRGITMTGVK